MADRGQNNLCLAWFIYLLDRCLRLVENECGEYSFLAIAYWLAIAGKIWLIVAMCTPYGYNTILGRLERESNTYSVQ